MTDLVPQDAGLRDLEGQLAALQPKADPALRHRLRAAGLPELLAQCRSLAAAPERPRLRTLHHFACSGGTLLSKCIAAMPCTRLLSEVDPLSRMTHRQSFVPTDLIGLARLGSSPPGEATLVRIFLAGLAALAADTRAEGRDLILRDHSHSHFCFGPCPPERPSLREILARDYQLLSLVTVRHPLDSYLSLQRQGWLRLEPATLDEYARRYHLFLDHYAGAEILRYEDFVAEPLARMQQICRVLDLSYNPDFQELYSALHLSGDSGRSGGTIAARPRRAVPAETAAEAQESPAYASLCSRLGYEPAPQAD